MPRGALTWCVLTSHLVKASSSSRVSLSIGWIQSLIIGQFFFSYAVCIALHMETFKNIWYMHLSAPSLDTSSPKCLSFPYLNSVARLNRTRDRGGSFHQPSVLSALSPLESELVPWLSASSICRRWRKSCAAVDTTWYAEPDRRDIYDCSMALDATRSRLHTMWYALCAFFSVWICVCTERLFWFCSISVISCCSSGRNSNTRRGILLCIFGVGMTLIFHFKCPEEGLEKLWHIVFCSWE